MKTTFLAAAIILGSVTLVHAQVPAGSYLQSCSNVRFDGRQLSAICADRYGRRVPTNLMVGNCGSAISNDNGQLACEYGGGGGDRRRMQSRQFDDDGDYDRPRPRRDYGFRSGESRIPGGSWHGSCKNAQMQGPMLTALCANIRGQFQQTTADTRSCRSFANRNGNLACE